jgi:hypothetical protein
VKKAILIALVLGLVAGTLSAPAVAGKKKKKKVKPVATTLFFHGDSQVGEEDSFPNVNDAYLKMDATEPASSDMKSKQIFNGVGTPNHMCAGNTFFPVWIGEISGTVVGDMKVRFHTVGTPGQVLVRLWPDQFSQACTSAASGTTDYVEPVAEVVVDLPPGQGEVEAVLEKLNFKASMGLMVQISPAFTPVAADRGVMAPFFSRVLYDSTDYPSAIEFNCVPAKGKSC